MRLLLDTHALLWWLDDNPQLPDLWKTALASPSNRVSVSSASILELAIKRSQGRLQITSELALESLPSACGFADLPVSGAHAAHVENLPWHHHDPFDRLLIAQARVEEMKLVSMDRQIRLYDVELL
jgi:PIN domain nuclease of toxin-antitoxin system